MEQSLPEKVLAINQNGFSLGKTVRIIQCAALCTCMMLLAPTSGCSMAMNSHSWRFVSTITDTRESVFISRRDLVDGGRYVEHPLLEQWKRHLNGRERNTFPGWTSKENIMRLAGTQTRPAGHYGQHVPQGEQADAYLNAWIPAPLSMYLPPSTPVSVAFDSVIPLEYPLTNLAQEDIVADDQSRETTGTDSGPSIGVLNRIGGSDQNFMELVFYAFGLFMQVFL